MEQLRQALERHLEERPGTLQSMKRAILHHARKDFVPITGANNDTSTVTRTATRPTLDTRPRPPSRAAATGRDGDGRADPSLAPNTSLAAPSEPRASLRQSRSHRGPGVGSLGTLDSADGQVQLYFQKDSAGVAASRRVWGRTLSSGAGGGAWAGLGQGG